MSKQKEQHRLGISDETMHSMRKFFLKHSVPKLIEKKRKEAELNASNDSGRNAWVDKAI